MNDQIINEITVRRVLSFILITLFYAKPVMSDVVDFSSLERTQNARGALSQHGIDLASTPVVQRSGLVGQNLLEISETRCDSLDIVFQTSAQVSSVTLEVTNRHIRSYLVSAYSSIGSEVLDEARFNPPTGNRRPIVRSVRHTLTSNDASKPIVKVTLTAPGASSVGCFDQAAITGLQFEGSGDPVELETHFRSFPSKLITYPLHQWYNRSTRDNYITTDPAWRGSTQMSEKEGYVWVGIMGYALSPRGSSNVPGTKALHTWYSASRNDHRTTTDPRWVPENARDTRRSGGYVHLRLEGYIFDMNHALSGTWPLQLHYNSSRREYDTTTRIPMLSATGARNDGYVNQGTQGYVIAAKPGDPQPGRDLSVGLSSSRRDNGTIGDLRGARNVLFIGQNYSNARLQNNRNRYSRLLSLNPDWNVRDYFLQISGGRYSIVNRGWGGTVTMQDDNTTEYDETDLNCMTWVPDENDAMPNGGIYTRASYRANVCSGFRHQGEALNSRGDTWGRRKVRWMIKSALQQADQSHDFSQYDGLNGGARDYRIETKELIIVVIMAVPKHDNPDRSAYPAVKQEYSAINRHGACERVDGVRLCGNVIVVNDGVSLASLAHELMHSIDNGAPDQDIYGGNQSSGMSLKSSTVGTTFNEQVSYTLDPWHRMRLGWSDLNIQPLDEQVPPSSATLINDGRVPIMFMSPERRGREVFLAEHRLQSKYHTTPLVNTQGIHVWYVNTPQGRGADLQPTEFPQETNWTCDATVRRWAAPTSPPGQPVKGPTGASLWTIGFEDRSLASPQCFRNRRGGWWTPLTKARGTKELLWYPANPRFGARIPAGTPSGLMLTAGELRADGIDLQWNAGSLPFKPLITTWATERNLWVLEGNFGHPEGRRVWLESPNGERRVLEIVQDSWKAQSIKVRAVPLTQEGRYRIQVENTEDGQFGNKLSRRATY